MAVLDRLRNRTSVEPRSGPMDDTPEPIEAEIIPPGSSRTAATVDQLPAQSQSFARPRNLPAIFYNAQMDFPGHIQKAVMDVQSAFESEDWTYFGGGDAWFRLNLKLDMVMAWVSSQVDAKGILRGQLTTVFDEYRELEDTVEDLLDLPFKKVEKIGAAMQTVGMALKESEKPFEAVPAAKMAKLFRYGAELPSHSELEKYGILQVAAYWKENMIDLGLDIFCVVETPKKIYPFGTGKTTLILQVAGAMATIMEDDFDPRRDVAYATDLPRIRRFFDDHERNQVRAIDEGKVVWGRRTAMTGGQKRDMALLSMTRKDEQAWLVAVSNIFRLDQDIFEEKATHVLRITDPGTSTIKRGWGQAILYEKTDCDEDKDQWGRRKFPIKWVDFGARSGIREVYRACDAYTKSHVRQIVEDDISPLDQLLSEQPDWNLDKLRDWMPNGGLSSAVDRVQENAPAGAGRPATSEETPESREN